MSLSHNQPPTREESAEIGATFLHLGGLIAAGDRKTTADDLAEYLTDDPRTASLRLWMFAATGPILVAAALQQLDADRQKDADGMWIIEQDTRDGREAPPHLLAAIRSTVAYLNGDARMANDIVAAHFDAANAAAGLHAAHDAMFEMVLDHLGLLATCIEAGAFPEART